MNISRSTRLGRNMIASSVLALMASCGGGSGGGAAHPFGSAQCDAIGGAVTVAIDPACTGCQVDDPTLTADGSLGSFATLSIPPYASGTGITVRATSLEHPAGTIAAIFVRIPESAQTWTGIMRTYLDGVEQESVPYSGTNYTPSGNPESVYGVFGMETEQPFDAIEIQVANAGYNSLPFEFRVYEFCSHVGID